MWGNCKKHYSWRASTTIEWAGGAYFTSAGRHWRDDDGAQMSVQFAW